MDKQDLVSKMGCDDFKRIPVVSRKDMEKLQHMAVPIARWLADHGLFHGEVHIDTGDVKVSSYEAGARFTDAELSEIFQEPENHA